MQWYVYHLIDTRVSLPIYVGKGKGRRAQQHVPRALRWKSQGCPFGKGKNAKLWNKILSILESGFEVSHIFIQMFDDEKNALDFEEEEIERIGLENLCNLTKGGEGEQRTQESLKKLSSSLQEFWASEKGLEIRKRFSEERMGEGNPRWGVVESEEHKIARMKNLLATPRWNKGLKGDPRAKGRPKGTLPANVIRCKLLHDDGRIIEGNSLFELTKLSGLSGSTIARLRAGILKKTQSGWRIEILDARTE